MVYGLTPGYQKTELDTVSPPFRAIMGKDSVVILNRWQENRTLEKLQWKEIYKIDASTFYELNKRCEEREIVKEARLNRCEDNLLTAEIRELRAVDNMLHYKTLYETAITENKTLKKENKWLPVYKGSTIVLTTTTIIFGFLALL